SVLTPIEYGGMFAGGLGKALELKTSAGALLIPREVTSDRATMGAYTGVLRASVDQADAEDDFINAVDAAGLPVENESIHRDLYRQLRKLADAGINGIWANIIRNAFAPL